MGPNAMGPSDPGLKPPKTVSQDKLFLFLKLIVSGNLYSNRKLTIRVLDLQKDYEESWEFSFFPTICIF
jgi:hypothetical protein